LSAPARNAFLSAVSPSFAIPLFLYMALASRAVAERKFHGPLESAPDAMAIVDDRGKIVLANAQTKAVAGLSSRLLRGLTFQIGSC
jgi:PAS domain-containing protein